MTEIRVAEVVFNPSIYPRTEWAQATVNRYAEAIEAGDEFPPIVLEKGSNRLLDGMHRLQAHKQALKDAIKVVWEEVPEGVPVKVFAASFSTRHGDRISGEELRTIAREAAEDDPERDMKTLAQYFGVTRQTVSRWIGDIVEHRLEVRRLKALTLSRAGWSVRQIQDHLKISKSQVSRDVNDDITGQLREDLLREAMEGLPPEVDAERIVEEIRQERIFAQWGDEERGLLKQLRDGEIVVVSLRDGRHNNLIGWADAAGLYIRIDRKTEWGNPFLLDEDGDRDAVIAAYEKHYLPHKPSLLAKLDGLRGRALGCWCAPEPCHGDVLAAWAEGRGEQ